MKKIILIATAICSFMGACTAQNAKKTENKDFQVLLNKFSDVQPPFVYKRIKHNLGYMTKQEAIQFFHKQERDLYRMEEDYNYDTDERSYYEVDNLPVYDFKYLLNDSIYMLGTSEGIYGTSIDSSVVCLYSFTLLGQMIDKRVIGGRFQNGDDIDTRSSFVLLNKNNIRVYYYELINEQDLINENLLTSVYYIDYQILGNGTIIQKDKSETSYLNLYPDFYWKYNLNSDDPMNEYDF